MSEQRRSRRIIPPHINDINSQMKEPPQFFLNNITICHSPGNSPKIMSERSAQTQYRKYEQRTLTDNKRCSDFDINTPRVQGFGLITETKLQSKQKSMKADLNKTGGEMPLDDKEIQIQKEDKEKDYEQWLESHFQELNL